MNRKPLVILSAILLALTLIALRATRARHAPQGAAVISVSGGIVGQMPLSIDNIFKGRGQSGPFELAVENNTVRMVSSTCEDGLCVKQGAIRSAGQSITCEANGVTVHLDGPTNNRTDVIAH